MKVCASTFVKLARSSRVYRSGRGPDRKTRRVPIDFESHGEEVLGWKFEALGGYTESVFVHEDSARDERVG